MTALTNEINYRVQELEQVATDLRNERTLAAADSLGRRIRHALGDALVQVGTALGPSHRQTSAEAR